MLQTLEQPRLSLASSVIETWANTLCLACSAANTIVTRIFTVILRAGAFSPILLINPGKIWGLNHNPKVSGGKKKLSSRCASWKFHGIMLILLFLPLVGHRDGPSSGISNQEGNSLHLDGLYLQYESHGGTTHDSVGYNYWHAGDNGTVEYGQCYLAGTATQAR